MSDGALSQDEIDALLGGVDSSSSGGSSATATAAAPTGSEPDRKVLQEFLSANVGALSANLGGMTGTTVTIKSPETGYANQDSFVSMLPDKVTVVKADYNSGFPGEHIFVLNELAARSIAGLINKEDEIELSDMAMSAIGEAVGTMVGAQITALTAKTGNKSIGFTPPTAANIPKAVAALPSGTFFYAAYQIDLGDSFMHQMWEVFGPSSASDIARALSGGGTAPAATAQAMNGMGMGMGAQAMNGMGMQNMGMGMPMQGMGMPMQGMGMQGMMGGMGGIMGGGMPMGPANVQNVQFPNLMQFSGTQEAGNIGLIMDVYMEMTVELGRTRKLIKDILSMGEGTIIELDKLAGEPVDILVNHKLIAKGEVVVIDENFGVRVTEIVSPMERMNDNN